MNAVIFEIQISPRKSSFNYTEAEERDNIFAPPTIQVDYDVLQPHKPSPNIKSSIKDASNRRSVFTQNKDRLVNVVSFDATVTPAFAQPVDPTVEDLDTP